MECVSLHGCRVTQQCEKCLSNLLIRWPLTYTYDILKDEFGVVS